MTVKPLLLTAFVGCWVLIMVLLVCCQIWLQRSFTRLRDHHGDTWEALGRPDVRSSNGAFYPARKFLWSRDCAALGDELLAGRARLAYRFGMAAAVLGLFLFGAILVGALSTVRD